MADKELTRWGIVVAVVFAIVIGVCCVMVAEAFRRQQVENARLENLIYNVVRDGGVPASRFGLKLLERVPFRYTTNHPLSGIEIDLLHACPQIQTLAEGTGVVYWGHQVWPQEGRIALECAASAPIWNRKAIASMADEYLRNRYPDIPGKVWAIEVRDHANQLAHTYAEGKWTEGPLTVPK